MEHTYFAPAGRSDAQKLAQQQQAIAQAEFITSVLDAVPEMMMILNQHRQIVAVNNQALSMLGASNQSELLGMRPGEAVSCIYSSSGPDGCGTSEHCAVCGSVLAVLACQESGRQTNGECRLQLSYNGGTALDLETTATPVDIAGNPFTIVALRDISAEKRKRVLERTFFHDVLNGVGGIRGIADLLATKNNLMPEIEIQYKRLMVDLSDGLAEEISQQRRLLAAERGEYILNMQEFDLKEMLLEVSKLYGNHVRAHGRTVLLEDSSRCIFKTDRSLLRRVVGNMVLNALEATPNGGEVKVSHMENSEGVYIMVTNPGEIPKDVQLSLFKRSFSTKSASGRGIGTYSMKLFGERYLGGSVDFRSLNGETVFSIKLPLT